MLSDMRNRFKKNRYKKNFLKNVTKKKKIRTFRSIIEILKEA